MLKQLYKNNYIYVYIIINRDEKHIYRNEPCIEIHVYTDMKSLYVQK